MIVLQSIERGDNRYVEPVPTTFQHYNASRDNHLTDARLGTQSLEPWRYHLRMNHDYPLDRQIANAVHLEHVKILMTALTDFKKQRDPLKLQGNGLLLEFKHARYEAWGIIQEIQLANWNVWFKRIDRWTVEGYERGVPEKVLPA